MILFSLRCDGGHEFEGWFRDGAAYERQHARAQVICPECGSSAVEKAPMAPRLGKAHAETAPPAPPTPGQIRRHLQELRRHVEANCEHVGPRFAEEAWKIHREEVEPRGIYGEATSQEADELADAGVEIARIPWVPSSDA